ncbi:MAG: molybdopterin converting factor subunit 1 [bacterium JZ-2024 1]
MKITVRYFGIASEIAGTREQTLEVPDGTRLSDLREQIFREFPRLAEMESALLFAVDAEVVDEAELRHGSEVAILPPVSGG